VKTIIQSDHLSQSSTKPKPGTIQRTQSQPDYYKTQVMRDPHAGKIKRNITPVRQLAQHTAGQNERLLAEEVTQDPVINMLSFE